MVNHLAYDAIVIMTSIAKIQFSNKFGNFLTHCILGCKHFRVEINHDIDEPCTALMQA